MKQGLYRWNRSCQYKCACIQDDSDAPSSLDELGLVEAPNGESPSPSSPRSRPPSQASPTRKLDLFFLPDTEEGQKQEPRRRPKNRRRQPELKKRSPKPNQGLVGPRQPGRSSARASQFVRSSFKGQSWTKREEPKQRARSSTENPTSMMEIYPAGRGPRSLNSKGPDGPPHVQVQRIRSVHVVRFPRHSDPGPEGGETFGHELCALLKQESRKFSW